MSCYHSTRAARARLEMVPWNGARTKVQIKLSIQRLRGLQEKKLALAKKSRREIADLLLKGRVETARLRVEGLIQDDIYVELLEVLELYVETLQARFGLLDASSGTEPEPSISDAVCAIVYAAPRTELKELQILREMLMHKYGREFSLALTTSEKPPASVPARVSSKLALFTPSKELVDAYLGEIAKGYGVSWLPEPSFPSEGGADGEGAASDDDGDAPGGTKEAAEPAKAASPAKAGVVEAEPASEGKTAAVETTKTAPPPPPAAAEKEVWAKKPTEDEELAERFERLKKLR